MAGDKTQRRLAAVEALHRQCAAAVYDKCLRILQDTGDAEDAVQETFLRAYGAWESFSYGPSRLPWLYRIATNVCLQTLRTRRRKGAAPLVVEVVDVGSSAAEIAAARQIVLRLFDELDERGQEILVAHFIDGMAQGEIATMLGISRRAVVKRLAILRLRAQEILQEPCDG